MYGLKEATVLVYQHLSKFLALEGYTHVQGTAGLSTHNTRNTFLKQLNYKKPLKPQYSLHKYSISTYNKKGEQQLTKPKDTTNLLGKEETTRIQSIVGALLYYARAIDNAILTTLNEISAAQSAPTEKTQKACDRLLDYVATYPNIKLQFHASGMKLHVDSDAAYLVASKARSRIAGYYNFSERTSEPSNPDRVQNIEICSSIGCRGRDGGIIS